jgi:hypothetical protein
MLKNNLKAAYIFSYLAVFAITFFGMSTVASAQSYDDGYYYDDGNYGSYDSYGPYSFYGDTSGYYDPNDGYYDQPSNWNDYAGYGGYSDYSFDPYSGYDNYSYGGYNDDCSSCGGSNNDYYANNYGNYDNTCYYYDCGGYDYPEYSTCGAGCSTGGTINETIVDVWNSNVNTNTNINYAPESHDHDDHDHDNDNNDNNEDFSVICKADDRNVEEGDRVRWIAEVNGVSDSRVDFSWSGDADGDDQEVTERYNKSGTYTAKVRARYNGQTETDTCTVRVGDDNNDDSNVTLVSNPPTGTPASLNSVYLSQVPYTGAAENAKLIGFITMLTLSSLAGAYYIVTRKARSDRKSFIERFKQDNIISKA